MTRFAVLAGLDLHPASAAAVRHAADLAEQLGAHLYVVHVVHLEDTPEDPDTADWDERIAQAAGAQEAAAAQLLSGRSISWSYESCHGDPAAMLADFARRHEVALVVVGATGGNVTRRLMEGGSVPHRLLRAGVPVLVVPPAAQASGG